MKTAELFENEIPEYIMLKQGFYLEKGDDTPDVTSFAIMRLLDDKEHGRCRIFRYARDTFGVPNINWSFSYPKRTHSVETSPVLSVASDINAFKNWVWHQMTLRGFPD